MPIILITEHFTVEAPDRPIHSRENGGHIEVSPKERYTHRYEMPLEQASSLMDLTMVVGEAATNVLRQAGIDIVRGNYQENGNWAYKPGSVWKPHLHIHIFFRSTHEKHPDDDPRFQAFPEAMAAPPLETGYYNNFKPLTVEDCAKIKVEIERLLATDKYRPIKL